MKQRTKDFLLVLGWGGSAAALLFCSPSVGEGVRQGLAVCAAIMIPSLFPFLILSDFLGHTRIGALLERPLGGLMARLYRCPKELAPAILMSWVGGYPAGARVLAGMVECGALSQEDAGLALTFCVNSGPAFLAVVVGAGVFGSPSWGLFLFGCQLVAGAVVGRLLCRRPIRLRPGKGKGGYLPHIAGFVQAVSSATAGMLSICAFVLVFSALAQLLSQWGLLERWGAGLSALTGGVLTPAGAVCLGTGLLEVSGGCALAQGLPPGQGALVLPFLLSFASFSVIGQLAACFGQHPPALGLLLRARLLHGVFTALLATPVLWAQFAAAPAMTGQPVLAPGSGALLGALCLMAMVTILASAVEGNH